MKLNFKKNIVLKDSISLLFVTLISKGVMFGVNILSIKFLTKSEYGMISLLRSTASLFESIFSGVNGGLVISEIAKTKKNTPELSLLYLFYFIAISVILFLMSFYDLNINILLTTFFAFTVILSALVNFYYIGIEDYILQKKMTFLSCMVGAILASILIIFYSYRGAILAFILLPMLDFLFKFFILIKRKIIVFNGFGSPSLIYRSFKYILVVVPQLVLFWFMKMMLGKTAIEDLATFEFLYQFVTVIILITGTVASSSIAKFTQSNRVEILKSAVKITIIYCSLFIIPSYIFANDLILLVNKNYVVSDMNGLFLPLLLTVFPLSIGSILNKFFLASKNDKYNLIASLTSVSFVLTYVYAVENFNIYTLIYSYVGYYSLYLLLLLGCLIFNLKGRNI